MTNYTTDLKTWGSKGVVYPDNYSYEAGEQPPDAWDNFTNYHLINDVKDHLIPLTNNRLDSGTGSGFPSNPTPGEQLWKVDTSELHVYDDNDSKWRQVLFSDGSTKREGTQDYDGHDIINVGNLYFDDGNTSLDDVFVNESGDTMEGNLSMGYHQLRELPEPNGDDQAVPRGWANDQFVNVSGDTWQGTMIAKKNEIKDAQYIRGDSGSINYDGFSNDALGAEGTEVNSLTIRPKGSDGQVAINVHPRTPDEFTALEIRGEYDYPFVSKAKSQFVNDVRIDGKLNVTGDAIHLPRRAADDSGGQLYVSGSELRFEDINGNQYNVEITPR